MRKTIIVDNRIPYIEGVLEPFFNVVYLEGGAMNSISMKEVSALVVRTRTVCDKELLCGTSIEAVFTATSGTDHIDKEYCKEADIKLYDARGSNAQAVAQWVWAAINEFQQEGLLTEDFTLGIVGVGAVGTKVLEEAQRRNIKTLLCDPPRCEAEGGDFVSLSEVVRSCDAITLHTPLDGTTYGMISTDILAQFRSGGVMFNASRGEVLLNEVIVGDSTHHFAVDVWEGEPNISLPALQRVKLATPHIAGYSSRGKALASTMTIRNIAHHFAIDELRKWDCASEMPIEKPEEFDITAYDSALRASTDNFEALRTVR